MQHRTRTCKQGTEIPLVLLHRQVIFLVKDRWTFWNLCSSLLVVPYYTHDHKARRWVALSIILVPLKIMEGLASMKFQGRQLCVGIKFS